MNIENLGIDGSILHSLTEDDFRDELGVSSKIMLKKIMACKFWTYIGVQSGFYNFDEYLKNNNKLNFTIKSVSPSKLRRSKDLPNQKIEEAP